MIKVGRPPKFKNADEMQEAIDAYFSSCWEPVMHKVLTPNGKKKADKDRTDEDYVWEPELDYAGKPVYRQHTPYTVTGLANALGMSRRALLNYEEKDEFIHTIKRAKSIVQQWVEEQLFRSNGQVTGAIFNLKNNYDWKDKTETDLTSKDERLLPGVVILPKLNESSVEAAIEAGDSTTDSM